MRFARSGSGGCGVGASRARGSRQLYWIDGPELWAELHAYCIQDVATERELHQRLPALPAAEQAARVIDAEINDAGVLIDVALAKAASGLAEQAIAELNGCLIYRF